MPHRIPRVDAATPRSVPDDLVARTWRRHLRAACGVAGGRGRCDHWRWHRRGFHRVVPRQARRGRGVCARRATSPASNPGATGAGCGNRPGSARDADDRRVPAHLAPAWGRDRGRSGLPRTRRPVLGRQRPPPRTLHPVAEVRGALRHRRAADRGERVAAPRSGRGGVLARCPVHRERRPGGAAQGRAGVGARRGARGRDDSHLLRRTRY